MKEYILQKILPKVEKPVRYLGNEWNAVHKDWKDVDVKFCFAFPDVYEIGMSHLGLRILYGLVNENPRYLMERVFAPWKDMEEQLRAHKKPLFALESYTPVKDFDVIGFTLQYELSYTNILNMLDLAGLPVLASERSDDSPLVVAGGPCAFNPEPLADFIDCFFIGEGEESLPEALEIISKHINNGRPAGKKGLLLQLAKLPGIYVPRFYKPNYDVNERFSGFEILADVPKVIEKRIVKDFDKSYFPTKPIVPFMNVVHDRVMLEVLRGCARGCRFCQAGIIYRPIREKKLGTLKEQANLSLGCTGYEEIALTSLSTADHSEIATLTKDLITEHGDKKIGLSLPSLRVDAFSVNIAKEVQKVRKTGLTFAPEAGTQRLRDVINKNVTEEDIMSAVTAAFEAGWFQIKLYFMIGLPTETMEDVRGIAEVTKKIASLGEQILRAKRISKRIKISVSVGSFVPKSHTPFQWYGQNTIQELEEKQQYLRGALKDRRIDYKWHDADTSFVEAVIAKGDRKVGRAIMRAWQNGCVFDGWSEFFRLSKWENVFSEMKLDASAYAHEDMPYESTLPWDHISAGVSKKWLWEEYQKALQVALTPNCRTQCTSCGVCPHFEITL